MALVFLFVVLLISSVSYESGLATVLAVPAVFGMATLTKDTLRNYELGKLNEIGVIAADIIYKNAAVGDNASGYGRPLVAGDPFRGFAEEKADNASGAAGDINVRLRIKGLVQLSISGLAITDVGKDIYASDDDTFTLTQGSNTRIGFVHRYVSSGVGIVAFNTATGAEAELTDSTTGTADGTVADVGGAFDQGTLNNNFADIIAKVNYLLRKMGS